MKIPGDFIFYMYVILPPPVVEILTKSTLCTTLYLESRGNGRSAKNFSVNKNALLKPPMNGRQYQPQAQGQQCWRCNWKHPLQFCRYNFFLHVEKLDTAKYKVCKGKPKFQVIKDELYDEESKNLGVDCVYTLGQSNNRGIRIPVSVEEATTDMQPDTAADALLLPEDVLETPEPSTTAASRYCVKDN